MSEAAEAFVGAVDKAIADASLNGASHNELISALEDVVDDLKAKINEPKASPPAQQQAG